MVKDLIVGLQKLYRGKKILVVGLGLQGGGAGVARFFAKLGAMVSVTDKKEKTKLTSSIKSLKGRPIYYRLGKHNLKDFLEADLIMKGPSVPWTLPEIEKALDKGIPVDMELSFFTRHFPGTIIGVTGTRGKSTTTNLIYEVLKKSGKKVHLGGSLPGISTIGLLEELGRDDIVVMELSSWALSGFHRSRISPHIAVFTNIYPDHLNYYTSLEEYLNDKKAVAAYQEKGDYLVLNKRYQNEFSGLMSTVVPFDTDDFTDSLKYLKGAHNLENAAAALKVGHIMGIEEKKAIDIISSFKGVPFRQETIAIKNRVIFVNDTTSTTPLSYFRG